MFHSLPAFKLSLSRFLFQPIHTDFIIKLYQITDLSHFPLILRGAREAKEAPKRGRGSQRLRPPPPTGHLEANTHRLGKECSFCSWRWEEKPTAGRRSRTGCRRRRCSSRRCTKTAGSPPRRTAAHSPGRPPPWPGSSLRRGRWPPATSPLRSSAPRRPPPPRTSATGG